MIIKAITKSDENVLDRYTIYFYDGSCLTLSSNCDSVQGISQFCEYWGINDQDFEEGALEGKKIGGTEVLINWYDLPPLIQAHAEKRIREWRNE